MMRLAASLAAACAALILLAFSAVAQVGLDYDAWTRVAERAEGVIEQGRASDSALEALRSEIAGYRDVFLRAEADNQQRIQTLQSQLDVLGAVPDSGTEPPEIAQRRAELTDQLARMRAPVIRAEEAYSRADGLIREIDATIRARQADALLELGPSPLNPQNWGRAVEALVAATTELSGEVVRNWASETRRAELRAQLPLILTLVAFAGVLVGRGRRWVILAVQKLRGMTRRGTGVWSFLVSLGQILLPMLGLLALSEAASATGMFGLRGQLLLDNVPVWGAIILFVRWLADQTFSRDDSVATVHLDSLRRIEARTYFNLLGLLLVARGVLGVLQRYDNFSEAVVAVLDFPILATCSLILFRLGQILVARAAVAETAGTGAGVASSDPDSDEDEPTPLAPEVRPLKFGIARLLGRAYMAVAVVGPVMSAIGYGNAGTALVYPSVLTLLLGALVLVLQRFLNDLYQLFTGRSSETADSLIPVLGGFALTIAALPVLALIWGARVADLTELWARFREGFQFGETRISPTDFLTFAVVFAIGYALTRMLQSALRGSVLPKTRLDIGGQNAIVSGVGYVGVFLAALIAITSAGLDLSSLAIVAGALSVGIGFGLQNIVQNFVSGIILLIERPISEGDMIEVGGQLGIVKDISVRSTRIETFDRTDVIVPNGDLVAGAVINYTRSNSMTRIFFTIGVAYGSDTKKVESILMSIIREHPKILANPAPSVIFANFGADSLNFEVRVILYDIADKLTTLSELNHEIARRFAEEGIEIPFAQRDIWLRNPEALYPPKPEGADT